MECGELYFTTEILSDKLDEIKDKVISLANGVIDSLDDSLEVSVNKKFKKK